MILHRKLKVRRNDCSENNLQKKTTRITKGGDMNMRMTKTEKN